MNEIEILEKVEQFAKTLRSEVHAIIDQCWSRADLVITENENRYIDYCARVEASLKEFEDANVERMKKLVTSSAEQCISMIYSRNSTIDIQHAVEEYKMIKEAVKLL